MPMAIKRRISGSEQAKKWPICGSCSGIHKAQMWQSTCTYMTINRNIHGNQQEHTWQSTGTYIAIKRNTHGNQQAHISQSTGTYMPINRNIHGNQQAHISQSSRIYPYMWKLFGHTKGSEMAIKRSRNW